MCSNEQRFVAAAARALIFAPSPPLQHRVGSGRKQTSFQAHANPSSRLVSDCTQVAPSNRLARCSRAALAPTAQLGTRADRFADGSGRGRSVSAPEGRLHAAELADRRRGLLGQSTRLRCRLRLRCRHCAAGSAATKATSARRAHATPAKAREAGGGNKLRASWSVALAHAHSAAPDRSLCAQYRFKHKAQQQAAACALACGRTTVLVPEESHRLARAHTHTHTDVRLIDERKLNRVLLAHQSQQTFAFGKLSSASACARVRREKSL